MQNRSPHIAALIVAAGRGTRAGGAIPKQYQSLGGMPLLARTVGVFAAHEKVASVTVVIGAEDDALAEAALPEGVARVVGAESRAGSVEAGLAALPEEASHVLIHDGARPLVSKALISRVIQALEDADGAAPALAVTDALWRAEGARVTGVQPRDGVWRAQTPQGFALAPIRAAHEAFQGEAADDVEVALAAGIEVALVPGEERNLKVTHPEDFARAERLLKEDQMDIRVGNGFDVHRFGPGDHVVLCGVQVPHGRGLQGHSDADVGMHAVTDAIYGALAEGDIGQHFPPSDPQWKGAASEIFLKHAVGLAGERGFALGNVDLTLICERPKIGPQAQAMRVEMARIIGCDLGRVSVKATTSERLGFTGREEGIAAMATVVLVPK
ncbi:bifunctional 2-C-methyl-D-erythritol 4-phosphate cytidylyltransferase/2-C-methyl-D-erythritol 2,4-cyclodiphosphate synthase [Vannielia litorea]|uniref:bifunctional 2-C-methyl-D-erythritol 4-phosphate cytidylyltransferase/2-C-methyl-D-erythritol 2,4-cyclodiphosphate synthase n=1 Tax=Vannielia litorea TaxID=1217970 RepID=UPI0028F6F9A8|nr:bifunctional 2-C-methyl-D-erythritol 4-phosphate cytidylyltransferase/2-C-methyl-D-erythritol 2,4-cyclodiphosphate synthase [Vannielia litorea]